MVPFPSADVLASRLMGPLNRPWALVGGGLAGSGVLWTDTLGQGVRLAWRLLTLLLSL
jgi:hypothetical protein